MELLLTRALGLLMIAVLVALAARWLRLPYTVGLVAVGMAVAATLQRSEIILTHKLVFAFILPPLLFEAALNIHWHELRRELGSVLALAITGTLIAAAFITFGLRYTLDWPLISAALFGALIASTDTVAVIAMFKDNHVGGRLRLLTEAESLFNDGAAAVLFILILGFATGAQASLSLGSVVLTLIHVVGGGIVIGALAAAAALTVAGHTGDHLVESTLTTVTAYGSFQLADQLHCSGVLATIVAGLLIGNLGVLADEDHSRITAQGRAFALELWEFIAFLANSVIFLLIGMTAARIPFRELGMRSLATIVLVVLASRALAVYPVCGVLRRLPRPVSLREQHVLFWGGLRGALGLALALSLPDTVPMRDEILIAAFGVVAFSVIVQGLTMPPLLKRLGFTGKAEADAGSGA